MSEQTTTNPAPEAAPAVPDMVITVEDSGAVRPGYDPRPDNADTEQSAKPTAADEGEGGDDAPEGDKPAASKPEAKPEDDQELPIGIRRRLTREERRREDAERREQEISEKLAQATAMVEALKARKEGKAKPGDLDPNDYDSYEDYSKAVAARKAGAPKTDAPAPEAKPDPEFVEALGDLREVVRAEDADLWAKATAVTEDGKPAVDYISRAMVLELADAADPAALLRAVVALSDDERAEIAGMSARGVRRAMRDLAGKAPAAKPAAPQRDPSTGQFRKQSEAPEPINPVSGSPVETSLEKLSPTDYIVRRNAEEAAGRSPFGWS